LIAAVALAAISLGFGTAGTVAFFKSNQSYDIEVTAAKVDVVQSKPTIVSKSLGFASSDDAAVEVDSDGTVKANLVAPGDYFVIKTSYTNNSTISIKYRIGTVASKGLKAEVFTDAECNTPAEDTSYTDLAKGVNIAPHYVKVTVEDDIGNGGTGKINVGVDAVQSNAYTGVSADNLKDKLADGGSIALNEDISLTSEERYSIDKDTVLDLNGKTLSIDSTGSLQSIEVPEGKTLTIRGGNLSLTGADKNKTLINTTKGNIVLENVNYKATAGTGIMYKGSGSHITIKDCNFEIDGYFGVSTNANKDNGDQHDSSVDIIGSTISVSNSENDNAGICFNAGGKYSITDTTINAQRQGIIVRSGDLTLNNVIINKTYDFVKADPESGSFGSGNEVPQAALFLGNGDTGNYTLPSKVTFAGPVTFEGVGPAIVASGSTTQDVDLETGTYYHGDVKVYDFRSSGDTHTFTINGNKIAIGTYDHAGKMTDEYTR
jgi:hypothetical protein